MNQTLPQVVPMPTATEPSERMKHMMAVNDYGTTFKLGDREFALKDLDYLSYIEFVKLASPLVEVVVSVIQPSIKVGDNGEAIPDFDLNILGMDIPALCDIAGDNLPRMVLLMCRQSAPDIQTADLIGPSGLVRTPFPLIEAVLKQIRHNKMVEEFVSFFPRLGGLLGELAPSLAEIAKKMAGGTPSS
jgi:hypothetical protein